MSLSMVSRMLGSLPPRNSLHQRHVPAHLSPRLLFQRIPPRHTRHWIPAVRPPHIPLLFRAPLPLFFPLPQILPSRQQTRQWIPTVLPPHIPLLFRAQLLLLCQLQQILPSRAALPRRPSHPVPPAPFLLLAPLQAPVAPCRSLHPLRQVLFRPRQQRQHRPLIRRVLSPPGGTCLSRTPMRSCLLKRWLPCSGPCMPTLLRWKFFSQMKSMCPPSVPAADCGAPKLSARTPGCAI
mmetsp:Transcript_9867/g.19981  ORF Transcript_9867/g.19981 Transcript_9867/m.19981 type:complete len:236 (-) Transcript_9867:2488-3195(-)